MNNLFQNLASIYLFKVNKRNSRKRCEIGSKLTLKTPEQCHFSVSFFDFEYLFAYDGFI